MQEPTILLGVGATKAGTSWLFDHLAGHPDCHLRSLKELHYFDTLEHGNFAGRLKVHRALAAQLAARAGAASGQAVSRVAARRADVADWMAVLAQRVENLSAYLAYLTHGRGARHLVADITPSYALLPVARLRAMAGMAADVRFVYLLRDPVARLWSQVRMLAARASASADLVPEAAFALLDRILDGATSGATERGDYVGAVTRLRAAVNPARLLVMFHEDMLSPAGLARLSAFLGIRTAAADFGKRVHAGPVLAMSDTQIARARVLLRPQYDFVASQFPVLPAEWRRNMGEDAL
ncbi:MAG: sulfotransferase [Paracoccaceae bacterium]|nr:sulfotransferase [Paracoccaceae bacterium]